MIYVFKTISYPVFIKVGYSEHSPDNRLKSIQTGCPYKIEILLIKEGRSALESMIHSHLKDFRVQGEWFIFSPDCERMLKEYLGEIKPRSVRKESLLSRRRPRKIPNQKLSEKIMELINAGETIRKTAETLGIHKDTVMRYKNVYIRR